MKNQRYIEEVIDYLFKTKNERSIMKAFVYRRVLNYTPKHVGAILRLSRVKVNVLIQTLPYKRLESVIFDENYQHCILSCEEYVIKRQKQGHKLHLETITKRL